MPSLIDIDLNDYSQDNYNNEANDHEIMSGDGEHIISEKYASKSNYTERLRKKTGANTTLPETP